MDVSMPCELLRLQWTVGHWPSAARSLGHSPATVTRAIAQLEERQAIRLLCRSMRSLRVTQLGESYLATCREVLAALDAAEPGATAEQQLPTGLLTITAPLMFGQRHVRPALDTFLAANIAIRARLLLLDRVVSLVEGGIDVAI